MDPHGAAGEDSGARAVSRAASAIAEPRALDSSTAKTAASAATIGSPTV